MDVRYADAKFELARLYGCGKSVLVGEAGKSSNHVLAQIGESRTIFEDAARRFGCLPEVYTFVCYWVGKRDNIDDTEADIGVFFNRSAASIFDEIDSSWIFQNSRYGKHKLRSYGAIRFSPSNAYDLITGVDNGESGPSICGRCAELGIVKRIEKRVSKLGVLDNVKVNGRGITRNNETLYPWNGNRPEKDIEKEIDMVVSIKDTSMLEFLYRLIFDDSLDVVVNKSSNLYERLENYVKVRDHGLRYP